MYLEENMIEKKYFFIINPIAGNGRGLAAWKKIRKTLQEQGISYTHKYTFPNQESNQEMILNTVDNLQKDFNLKFTFHYG